MLMIRTLVPPRTISMQMTRPSAFGVKKELRIRSRRKTRMPTPQELLVARLKKHSTRKRCLKSKTSELHLKFVSWSKRMSKRAARAWLTISVCLAIDLKPWTFKVASLKRIKKWREGEVHINILDVRESDTGN
ncbi:unnamed protein product [Ixodes pacificus]